jgi:hypothetical protein
MISGVRAAFWQERREGPKHIEINEAVKPCIATFAMRIRLPRPYLYQRDPILLSSRGDDFDVIFMPRKASETMSHWMDWQGERGDAASD